MFYEVIQEISFESGNLWGDYPMAEVQKSTKTSSATLNPKISLDDLLQRWGKFDENRTGGYQE